MTRIMVTGASGKLGAKVVASLLETQPAGEIAVLVRDAAKAQAWRAAGVEVRVGEYDDPAALQAAFAGVERLLLISGNAFDDELRIRQHANVIAAAGEAGVRFLAYTSLPRADVSTLPLAKVHGTTEGLIRASGMAYCFLRNNMYLDNEAFESDTIQQVLAGGAVVTSAGDGRVGWVLRWELARAAAAVLAGPGHEGEIYELSGPPASYADLAAALGQVLERPVEVKQVDRAAYEAIFEARGLPYADFFGTYQDEVRDGEYAIVSDDLERVLGRPPLSLQASVRALVEEVVALQAKGANFHVVI